MTRRATYSVDGRLGQLIARGARLRADVADRVTSAALSLSATEVTQLDLALIDDSNLRVLESRLFDAGTPTRRGSRLDYGRLRLEVRAIEVAPRGTDHIIRIAARSLGVGNLKRARGPLVRRNLTPTQFVALEARAAGLRFIGQPSPRRNSINRKIGKDAETSWDTAQRLAEELGYLCFEAAGVLYFGKPTWLIDHTDRVRLAWRGDRTGPELVALPTCRRSGDDRRRYATVSAEVLGELADTTLPGMALDLAGVPTFSGRYMVDSVSLNLAEGRPATINASTPTNPRPQPPSKPAKAGSSSTTAEDRTTTATGARSASSFVALCLEQAGDSYVFGAEASASSADPSAFDCSELIEWALARVGVPFVDGSSAQIARCKPVSVAEGIRTRGALLWHPGHIAVSLGDGRTIEAANSRVGVVSLSAAGRFTRAGLVPGLRY